MKLSLTFILCAFLLPWLPISTKGADATRPASVQFDEAYNYLVKGDEARDANNPAEAIKMYREALDAYIRLAEKYPQWQPGVVKFRAAYCNDQLESLLTTLDGKTLESEEIPEQIPQQPAAKTFRMNAEDQEESADGKRQEIAKLKTRAKMLLRSGKPLDARTSLLKALTLDPDDTTVRLLLGMAQCQADDFEDAVYLLEQLVNEYPSNANARVVLGTAYFGLGRVEDARLEMRQAIDIAPDVSEAHYNMAQILLTVQPPDTNAARHHYRQAIDLGGQPDRSMNYLLRPGSLMGTPAASPEPSEQPSPQE